MWFVDRGIEVLRLPCVGESLQSKLRMVDQLYINGISRSTIVYTLCNLRIMITKIR